MITVIHIVPVITNKPIPVVMKIIMSIITIAVVMTIMEDTAMWCHVAIVCVAAK